MLKWLGVAVAAVVLVLIAAVVALPYLVDLPRIQSMVSQAASQALARPVRFASMSLAVLPLPAVRLEDLEVAEDPSFGEGPFLAVDAGSLRLRLWPLLAGRVEFGELRLEQPRVSLIRDSTGRLNVATLGARRESAPPARPGRERPAGAAVPAASVSRVSIVGGEVSVEDRAARGRPVYRLRGLELALQEVGTSSPIRFAGRATLDPGAVGIRIRDGSLELAGARAVTEAPLRATLDLDARNIGELAVTILGPRLEVAGPVKGSLTVSGTANDPSVSGLLEMSRLAVSQTRPACAAPHRRTLVLDTVRLPVALTDGLLTARPLSARLADGDLTAAVAWSAGGGGAVRISDLAVRALSLEALLVDFLCQGYAVTGPLDLAGDFTARPADLLGTLSGSGRFTVGAGKVVGPQALRLLGGVARVGGAVASILSVDAPTSLFASPLDFDSISATYTIRNGLADTRDLHYRSRPLDVNVVGQYRLSDGQVKANVVMRSGRGEIAATVSGLAGSPSVRVDPAVLVQKRGIQRGVRDVEEGVRDLLRRLK
jgi:AsmA protein